METLRKRITYLLSSQSDALDAEDLEKRLDVPHVPVMNALLALRKKGVIKSVGQPPLHYIMNVEQKSDESHISPADTGSLENAEPFVFDINKVAGPAAKKVAQLVHENNDSPLNAREIAEKLGIKLTGARYFLSVLKTKGIIKCIGRQPWHYAINDGVKPEKKKKPKKAVKKAAKKSTEKTSPTMKDFDEYLMVYTTQESDIPLLQTFRDPAKFSDEFESQQQRSDLIKIAGYRRLACRKRVVFTPEIK